MPARASLRRHMLQEKEPTAWAQDPENLLKNCRRIVDGTQYQRADDDVGGQRGNCAARRNGYRGLQLFPEIGIGFDSGPVDVSGEVREVRAGAWTEFDCPLPGSEVRKQLPLAIRDQAFVMRAGCG